MPVDTLGLLLEVGPDVHAGAVVPEEERLLCLDVAIDEIHRLRVDFLVDGFHALRGQRAGIFDGLATLAVRLAVEHTAWTILLFELGIFRVVVGLRLFFGIQVIQVAEELVEPVHRRQVLVLIAEVVLAELSGRVALLLKEVGNGRRPVRDALRAARHADGQQARTERMLSEDERRPTGGAALLGVGVGEERPFFGDAIDVGGLVPHDAVVVRTDVVNADVVAPEDDDVWLLTSLCRLRRHKLVVLCQLEQFGSSDSIVA